MWQSRLLVRADDSDREMNGSQIRRIACRWKKSKQSQGASKRKVEKQINEKKQLKKVILNECTS